MYLGLFPITVYGFYFYPGHLIRLISVYLNVLYYNMFQSCLQFQPWLTCKCFAVVQLPLVALAFKWLFARNFSSTCTQEWNHLYLVILRWPCELHPCNMCRNWNYKTILNKRFIQVRVGRDRERILGTLGVKQEVFLWMGSQVRTHGKLIRTGRTHEYRTCSNSSSGLN